MIITSLIYAAVSLCIIIAMIVIVFKRQYELASSAVYFMLGILFGIAGWIIGDMFQIIFSKPGNEVVVLVFSVIATISSMLAMGSTVLFARVLSARRTLNSKTVVVGSILFGATVFLTLTAGYPNTVDNFISYTVNSTDYATLDFIVTEAHFIWIICDAAMVLYAGGTLVWYLSRQYRFVEEKHKKILAFMIAGTIIAFIVSAVLYSLYAFAKIKATLHLELVSASIGAAMIGIGMIVGGKRALYGSSRVYSVHVFSKSGLSIYAGLFEGKYDVNEHLISGVATAISNFAGQLIGKDVVPREIDLGDYSLMLEEKGEYIGFIICEFPSVMIRQGLKNIMKNFDPEMSIDDISEFVDDYLPYGKPNVMDLFEDFDSQ
ncbi:MAG: hypothetical protein GOP50_12605 [Candidatus Heimdallarchaeota archaeon]|nr:hypothetical protein [Candidatus Heimdallarchaeota archaeon]